MNLATFHTSSPSSPLRLSAERILTLAGHTLRTEADAVQRASQHLGPSFVQAVRLLQGATGRVVVMGMGKSGHVGRKIAATLASTGTPAMFVHPAEASHGDLGMITPHDAVLAISNSGEVDELTVLLPLLKRMEVPLIAMTSRATSSLGRCADAWIDSSVEKEACPHNLAPTTSTTVQLALGDALAMCLLEARGFKPEDFARSHPGGALGRRLLTHVHDVMRSGDAVPQVPRHATLSELMREMSTDGDLRRLIESGAELRHLRAADVMRPSPRTVPTTALAVDAAQLMETHRISSVLVVDETGHLCGALNTHDLMRAKVI
jgi:arabinose-5-phosphate isomerase